MNLLAASQSTKAILSEFLGSPTVKEILTETLDQPKTVNHTLILTLDGAISTKRYEIVYEQSEITFNDEISMTQYFTQVTYSPLHRFEDTEPIILMGIATYSRFFVTEAINAVVEHHYRSQQ